MDVVVQIRRELSAMFSPRHPIDLALIVLATTALGAASCRSKAQPGTTDGGVDGGVTGDAANDAHDDGAAGTDASAMASAAPPPPVFAPEPTSTQFAGSYRCFKGGMTLQQAGRIVTSTMHTSGTTDTVVACSVNHDDCIGTVREIQVVRGKSPKVVHVKPVTLHRTPNGDVVFKVAAAPGAHESKPGAGTQTFCPRR